MKITSLAVLILFVSAAAGIANAQTARSGGGNADAKLMQQMQQLASERTQLQADNARLKKELEDFKKQMKALESEKDSLGRKAQTSQAALSRSAVSTESLNQSLAQQRTRMEELVAKFRETATTLRDVETERTEARSQLASRDRELNSCIDKNKALYQVNTEVLDRFEHQGLWSSLAKTEPFTRLKRTEIENLADAYRSRAEERRMEEGKAAAPPGN